MINIKPGQIYRHFKGGCYEVINVAWHTETGVPLVIYSSLDDGTVWARPIDDFLSLVDRNKYLDAAQLYRFELMGGRYND